MNDLKTRQILKNIPPEMRVNGARQKIAELNQSMNLKLVVLDDDPTGCQTVHSIKILTVWEPEILKKNLEEKKCFYILTNSRAYSEKEAIGLNTGIATELLKYTDRASLRIISRSDSTLRGHFFGEVKALMDVTGPYDGILIIPYFKEGGRYTLFDTHYLQQGKELVAAHETEFAKDPVFGFKNSNLCSWVEEKSGGFWKKEEVISISLDHIRRGGQEKVYEILKDVANATPVIINALCDEDLEIAVLAICQLELEGKKFLYRSAASFAKIRAGITDKALYIPEKEDTKGLVIVGSHVQKTTDQLYHLLKNFPLEKIEVKIASIFSDKNDRYLNAIVKKVDKALNENTSVVVYTERNYSLSGDHGNRLRSGMGISSFLLDIVARLSAKPDFIISKGGITSHDIARKELGMKESLVMGQVFPGVPVWKPGNESKYPEMPYVVFPGNVGDEKALSNVFLKFRH